MNAIQSGMNDTPRVDAKASMPSLVSIKSLSPLPVIPGLLLATTGLFAPTGLLAEDIRCESEAAAECIEKKLKATKTLTASWTPTTANSSVLINENAQVILSAEVNNEPGWREFGSLTVGQGTKGELTITGRTIKSSASAIGNGAVGIVTLTEGAQWDLSGKNLFVGKNNGDGTLTVKEGSQISNINELRIGEFYADAKGLTTIEGENSSIRSGWAVVGDQAEGRLDILNGGQLSVSRHMNIGYVGKTLNSTLKGNGVVNVDGENSRLEVGTLLILGGFITTPNDAKGELNISNGGKVKTGEGIWLGIGTGSTATLNIGGKPGETAQEAGSIETPLIILSDTNQKNSTATLNFNHTSEDYSLNAAIKGYGHVNHSGPGTTQLSGDNRYTGNTHISRGTLSAGSVTGFSPNSDFTVGEGATLDLNGYSQTIQSLQLGGRLSFGDPQGNRDALALSGSVLTVRGDYNSDNGLLSLNSTQDQVQQKPVVNQLNVLGNTAGTTRVVLKELGNVAVGDLNGARVVQVAGDSAGEFVAQSRLVAGGYDYALLRGVESENDDGIMDCNHWYLVNTWAPVDDIDPIDDPIIEPKEDDPTPLPTPSPGVERSSAAVMRPEMGAYLANRRAANTLFVTRLHDRLGETQYIDPITGETRVTSLWLRNVGGHTRFQDRSGQLSSQSNRYVVQIGGDLAQWSSGLEDRWHLGVMTGYANSQSNTRSSLSHYRADSTVSGYSAGLYATWYADNAAKQGTWIDAWVLYNWFENTVRGESLAEERYRSKGMTASLEMGHTVKLAEQPRLSYWLQPQAQLIWMDVSADDHREDNGTWVRDKGKGNLQSRLGVKAFMQGYPIRDEGKDRLFQPFVELNWLHNTRNDTVSMNEISGSVDGAKNIAELRTGVEAKINSRLHLWGNIGQQIGSEGFSDTQAVLGLKLLF
ncbi:TPA: autotransporter outer membrane beta-barrel domain-containing protein [Citrobacter amalonaticus]|uniref:autotransporter outer membrane beta-barrel domain-containing protein n=1 Tax=Citrobacter amalonaticus TaxID=35703 RepID=UPI00292B48D1|nr:autotransporter outer membrane beta-barrel domain-containing protein [Citrobacter amalonaticus]EKW3841778.1 autotransporter outer membrane beta-barrel domain-containing protein [Citrobacter amalonaticus]MDV0785275.1 autotransporter outer membrane beta-barrel domain-containing protein [Citrobacter amalonaticus]MEB0641338.1 autotransporter outer membrane beta-barrel domain-containing protein [Citrobacter amalonaticus]